MATDETVVAVIGGTTPAVVRKVFCAGSSRGEGRDQKPGGTDTAHGSSSVRLWSMGRSQRIHLTCVVQSPYRHPITDSVPTLFHRYCKHPNNIGDPGYKTIHVDSSCRLKLCQGGCM